MGRSIVHLVLAFAAAVAPRNARAAAPVGVTRGEGAEQCPDADTLQRRAESSRGSSPGAPTHVYRASFVRAGGLFRAEVIDETAHRSRRLVDRGPACAPLGQAVAMVLATMWGSERDDAAPPPDAPPLPAPVPPPSVRDVVPPHAAAPSSPSPSRWAFGAGGGIAAGVVRPVAPFVLADAALERGPLSVGLGAFWIPQQHLPLGAGAVDVQLFSGALRGCVLTGGGDARLGLCARLFAGAIQARGSGYDIDAQKARPWLAGALELFVGGALPLSWLRYRVAAGAIVPVHAEAFSVSGAGSAYETPALGGLFTLSLEVAPAHL